MWMVGMCTWTGRLAEREKLKAESRKQKFQMNRHPECNEGSVRYELQFHLSLLPISHSQLIKHLPPTPGGDTHSEPKNFVSIEPQFIGIMHVPLWRATVYPHIFSWYKTDAKAAFHQLPPALAGGI